MRRTDAKAYFANERTFLHWLSVSVTVGSISAAMAGVAGHAHKHWGTAFSQHAIVGQVVAICLLATAIFMASFAALTYAIRASLLKHQQDTGYQNRTLPIVFTVVILVVLAIVFIGAWEDRNGDSTDRHRHMASATTAESVLHAQFAS